MTLLTTGAQEACQLFDSDHPWFVRHCDPMLYPDAYQEMGMIFWGAVAVLTLLIILIVRKMVFSAFTD